MASDNPFGEFQCPRKKCKDRWGTAAKRTPALEDEHSQLVADDEDGQDTAGNNGKPAALHPLAGAQPATDNLQSQQVTGRGRSANGKRKAPGATGGTTTSIAPGLKEKLGDFPLRLVIVGHNPSAHAWASGHYYSNPGNRMWPILCSTGIAPPTVTGPEDDDRMAAEAGVGFTDVGTGHPGTNSADFKSSTFIGWRKSFFSRLAAHLGRASSSIGCECGRCGAPCIVAFCGKRHFLEVYNVGRKPRDRLKTAEIGQQRDLPLDWPLPTSTRVWLLPSTSGASALTREQREGPYRQLKELLTSIPWPRTDIPNCRQH
eukprot:evm.model.scf_794.2 EVM.evm.TU.scf_794.2   scf_794:37497-41914(+)